jgi:DNA-binding transcriptional regulator YhcF (GntR family)
MAQLATQWQGLRVDRDSDLSPGIQLSWELRAMIAAGKLGAGERLPSVRELAAQANVNVNTARSVYRRLEHDGLIVSKQGLGTFVSDRIPGSTGVEELAAQAIAGAREAGIDPRQLATALYAAGAKPSEPGAASPLPAEPPLDVGRGSDESSARRELRRQIAHLEQELAGYAGELRRGDPGHPLLQAQPRVAGVEQLEEVRDGLLDQLAGVRERQARRGRRQGVAKAHIETMAREPSEHKWQWVSNEDVGEPGCRTWRVTPRYGPIGALMGWWRVKVSSGCPLTGAAGGGNDDQHRRRQGVHAREVALRPGREHDDPDRQDDDLCGAPAVPLRG